VDADQMQQQRAARRVMARDAVAHARHGCTAYRFGRRGAPAVAGSDADRRPLKRAVLGAVRPPTQPLWPARFATRTTFTGDVSQGTLADWSCRWSRRMLFRPRPC
jgi:hypothetical protein